jgi:hypothetical protein
MSWKCFRLPLLLHTQYNPLRLSRPCHYQISAVLRMAANIRISHSELLNSAAQEAWKAIFEVAKARKPPSCEGADIALQLKAISEALDPQSLSQKPPDELCLLVLQDVFDICTVCSAFLVWRPLDGLNRLYFPDLIKHQFWSWQYNQFCLLLFLTHFSMMLLAQPCPFCA